MTYGAGTCPLVGVFMDQNEAVPRYQILSSDLSVLTHQKQSPQNHQLVPEKQFDAVPNLRTQFQTPNPIYWCSSVRYSTSPMTLLFRWHCH